MTIDNYSDLAKGLTESRPRPRERLRGAEDTAGYGPADRYAVLAEQATDPTMARSYRELAKSAFPDHATLEEWARTGLAFTLQSGRIVPGCTVAQVNDCIQRAKGSLGHGGDWDDQSLRTFLTARSKALGLQVPVWSGQDSGGYAGSNPGKGPTASTGTSNDVWPLPARPGDARSAGYGEMTAGKSRFQAVDALVAKATAARSVADALVDLAAAGRLGELQADIGRLRQISAAGGQIIKAGPPRAADGSTAAGRAYVEAQRYDSIAKSAADPATAESYRQLAKLRRTEAGL